MHTSRIRIIKHEAAPGAGALRFDSRMVGPASTSIGMTPSPSDKAGNAGSRNRAGEGEGSSEGSRGLEIGTVSPLSEVCSGGPADRQTALVYLPSLPSPLFVISVLRERRAGSMAQCLS